MGFPPKKKPTGMTGGKPRQVTTLKIWTLDYADKIFSLFIRKRDGKCRRCLRWDVGLDCSHYWERGWWGTRFDPKNCIALCRSCHQDWDKKQNWEYKDFMHRLLGADEYRALEQRAKAFKKRWDAIREAMEWLSPLAGQLLIKK